MTIVKNIPSAPFNASVSIPSLSKSQLSRAPPPNSLLSLGTPKWEQQLSIRVQRPRDARSLRRIHAVIEGITEHGADFESLLMQQQKQNEDYAFLFDSTVIPRIYN